MVRRPGAGPQVVFVHGGLDRSSSFGRVARNLADLTLVRYDRRGYGRSLGAGPGSLEEHIADLLAVIGDQDTVVFGHSVGGVIALGAAELRPDLVRAVLAYEAPTPWAPWWPRPTRSAGEPADEAERFMRRMVGDHIWERLPSRTREDRRAEGPALSADLASMDRSSAPWSLSTLAVPVLSAAGSETSWWHRRAAEEIAEQARFGEFTVVEGAGHGVHLTHPTATANLVRRLVALGSPPDQSR